MTPEQIDTDAIRFLLTPVGTQIETLSVTIDRSAVRALCDEVDRLRAERDAVEARAVPDGHRVAQHEDEIMLYTRDGDIVYMPRGSPCLVPVEDPDDGE